MNDTGGDNGGDRELLAAPARQSVIALVFIAGKFVRRIGIINIAIAVVFVFSGRLAGLVVVVAFVAGIVVLLSSALSWWRFTYCINGDELIVTKGVLTVERLVIPLDRVQSVGIEQRLLHRVVGLVAASVDTAGTDGVEFTIDAVERHRAEALQRIATGTTSGAVPAAHGVVADSGVAVVSGVPTTDGRSEVVIRRTPRELALVGLTAVPWAGLVALFPLLAFADEIGGLFGRDVSVESTAVDTFAGLSPRAAALTVFVLLVAATAIGLALQVVRSLLSDWDLTVVRTSVGLRRTAGWASTASTASTIRRIQAVSTRRPPIQRTLGIRRVTLETIGAGNLAIPGSTDAEVDRLRSIVFNTTEPAVIDRSVSRWMVFLEVRKVVLICVAAVVATASLFGWWALVIMAVVPLSWAFAERAWRLRRWGFEAGRITELRRVVSESTTEIDVVKAQAITLRQSFFERRRNLASVSLRTASGSITIPLIPCEEAEDLRDSLLYLVESSGRPGM